LSPDNTHAEGLVGELKKRYLPELAEAARETSRALGANL